MARKLDAMPADLRKKNPWDEWLDGDVWELTRGEDFQTSVESFRRSARIVAANRGLGLVTRLPDEKTVILQATSPNSG